MYQEKNLRLRALNVSMMLMCLCIACLSFASCQKVDPDLEYDQANQNANLESLTHTVSYPGETLGIISRWYTGNASNWRTIVSFNNDLEPTKIAIGQDILIPRELVVQEVPMPKSFVKRVVSGKSTSKILVSGAESPAESGGTVVEAAGDSSKPLEQEEKSEDNSQAEELALDDVTEVENKIEKTVEPVSSKLSNEELESDAERERLLDELLE